MNEFEITVKIAGRSYQLKIKREEEENIRRAAKILEEKTNDYSKNFAQDGFQDVLAMAALDVAMALASYEKEDQFMKDVMQKKLNNLNELLDENI